jgi:tRNA U34 5-methylaminomethyl-2-thiouridine-forming methyltransferase MnmC
MKTQDAIKLAGSARALAEILGITGGAISQWPELIPEARVWQLRVLKPEWFADKAPATNPES